MLSSRWRDAEATFASWMEDVFSSPESCMSASPECLEIMRHSMLAPSKHFRPVLFLLTLESLGVARERGKRGALALECVHTYSLIHDDLPCMDDDDFRRGRPSSHKRFGEAKAVLAGDALLTLAFEFLGAEEDDVAGRMASILARAAGCGGMVAGQVMDLDSEGRDGDAALLAEIHERKTGALIGAAMAMAGAQAKRPNAEIHALDSFGRLLGRAFQAKDDILDVEGEKGFVGKSIGKDAAQKKLTLPSVMGLSGAKRHLSGLISEARNRLDGLALDRNEFTEILGFLDKREG